MLWRQQVAVRVGNQHLEGTAEGTGELRSAEVNVQGPICATHQDSPWMKEADARGPPGQHKEL